MPSFEERLKSDKFIVTAELTPPKGTDLSDLVGKADRLKDWVDAFNLTDSAGAIMTMAPIGAAHALRQAEMEPILQLTASNRNRIAIQGDLLAASSLGLRTVLCMAGDPPANGDNPEAKVVYDLDAVAMLNLVRTMNSGKDLAGKNLRGAPNVLPGAVANPGAPEIDKELARMEEKVAAGARFFQTQGVYDIDAFGRFMERARDLNTPLIAGFIILKSGDMARRLNATLPGVTIPDNIIDELDAATDKAAQSIEIAARIIRELPSLCAGVHMMAIGWEDRIPAMLEAAGLEPNANRALA